MQVSYRWLKDIVDYQGSLETFCERMSLTGTKVEAVTHAFEDLTGVKIAKILAIEAHPDADRLRVCHVDLGGEELQILTAAPNVEEGQVVPVATVGAVLHQGLKIQKSKMRGLDSHGMLCSIAELGLTTSDYPEADPDGIFILPESAPLGEDVLSYLGQRDHYIDFEITPNRPDCLSVMGIAREFAASFDLPFQPERFCPSWTNAEEIERMDFTFGDFCEREQAGGFGIQILDQRACPHYLGQHFTELKLGPSPDWLRRRLRASGIRSINNLVDVTNYVMLVTGNPLHAFDASEIEGSGVSVRWARDGEELVTLDGIKRSLTSQDLVIADREKALALAGVMGGESSEITADTQSFFLEIAHFEASVIRKTAARLNLHSESSLRFARGISAHNILLAHSLFLQLITELDIAKVAGPCIYAGDELSPHSEVEFRPQDINELLGLDIPEEEQLDIFARLGFEISAELGRRQLVVPTWRVDIEATCDLAEEVARFYGYNRIPARLRSGVMIGQHHDAPQEIRRQTVLDIAIAAGAYEVCSMPFASQRDLEQIGLSGNDLSRAVKIANPLGQERAYLAVSLLPRMIEHQALNQTERESHICLVEMGKSFTQDVNANIDEEDILALSLFEHGAKGQTVFLKLKGIVEEMEDRLSLPALSYEACDEIAYFQPGQAAKIMMLGEEIGLIGCVHPDLLAAKEARGPMAFCELKLSPILNMPTPSFHFAKPSKYPAISRDLAIVAPRQMPQAQIYHLIAQNAGPQLTKLSLFDFYQGDRIDPNFKSLAYALEFRSASETLQDKQVDMEIEKIIEALAREGLTLRS